MSLRRTATRAATGPFTEPLPAFLARRLAIEHLGPGDVRLCAGSDLDLDGGARGQWIAVTDDLVFLGSDGDDPADVSVRRLREATLYRTLAGVGGGLLQASIDGVHVDLLRYSNRHAFRFEAIAKKLDRALHGEPITVEPGEDVDPRLCPTCGLMLDFAGDTCPQCVSRGRVLRRILALFRPYRGAATLMMALLVGGIALDLVSPLLTRYLVDNVLPGSREQARALAHDPALMSQNVSMLLHVVLILALVQVLRQVVNGFTGLLSARVGTALTFDVRGRLVRHLQRLAVGYYDRQQVGALMGRVAYDTENLHDFVSQVTGGFLLQVLMIAGVGLSMFALDARLAVFTLVPAPFVMLGTVFFWRYIYPRYYRVWDAGSKQAGMLTGLLSGIRVVKAFNQEERQERQFSRLSERVRRSRRDVEGAIATFNPVMGIVFQLGGWIVWFVGGREVLEQRLTLGELMAFFGYLWMFYGPLGMLPQFTNWLTQFLTQVHRLFEILDTPQQIGESADPVHVDPMEGRIELRDVSFGYQHHAPVLKDLSLSVAPGEMVGLVGPSGSGKSTIINLICRFYDVDEGAVLIDGVDVRRIPTSELRGQVGVALQEAFLFRGSIWQNLAFGRPEAAEEDVISAAKAADCHDFVMRQPHGYDTWVGEGGTGLSGGERQRVGIARVLLTDPRILILDESTSSVDNQTEASIQSALAEVMRGRTTIAIAHRLSTLRGADRIFVLDGGQVVESGPPAELLAQGGRFAQMVRARQGEPGAAARQRFEARAADRETRAFEDWRRVPEPVPAGVLPPLAGHHPRWLDPRRTGVTRGELGEMIVDVHGEALYRGVFALRCLPVRHPAGFISLRHIDEAGKDVEVGLVRRLEEWPPAARSLVEASLRRRYFVQAIRAVHSIRLFNNYLRFDVETDLGPQRFTLRWQQERAQDYGAKGKMLLDTDENRYLIADVDALPPRDRRIFRRFIYW